MERAEVFWLGSHYKPRGDVGKVSWRRSAFEISLEGCSSFVIWNWRVDFVKRRQFAQRCGRPENMKNHWSSDGTKQQAWAEQVISKLILKQRIPFSNSFRGGPACNNMTVGVL